MDFKEALGYMQEGCFCRPVGSTPEDYITVIGENHTFGKITDKGTIEVPELRSGTILGEWEMKPINIHLLESNKIYQAVYNNQLYYRIGNNLVRYGTLDTEDDINVITGKFVRSEGC